MDDNAEYDDRPVPYEAPGRDQERLRQQYIRDQGPDHYDRIVGEERARASLRRRDAFCEAALAYARWKPGDEADLKELGRRFFEMAEGVE